MPNDLCFQDVANAPGSSPHQVKAPWHSFEEILRRLHAEGIYIHADQLAAFLLFHGLPVHPRYVPAHLQKKAAAINQHYRGDMAELVEETEQLF